MTECEQCGEGFDPVACRWRCPLCGAKANCCEGEPQPPMETPLERFQPQGWCFI